MRATKLTGALGAAVLGLVCFGATSASANFHEVKITELYSSLIADDYVELQMYSAGQNQMIGHTLTVRDNTGAITSTVNLDALNATGGVNPPNSESQRTVLIGNIDTALNLGVTPDFTGGVDMAASGGAICFENVDCAAWGNIMPAAIAALPDPQVGPAEPGGMISGESITRKITANCATALDAADDTANSFADFSSTSRTPRPNSVTPTETLCTTPPPDSDGDGVPNASDACPNQSGIAPSGCPDTDGDGVTDNVDACPTQAAATSNGCPATSADTDPPETKIDKSPKNKLTGSTAVYKFSSDEENVTFECKIDKKPFKPCTSPKRYKRLKEGKHSFKVKATDAAGNVDTSAAGDRFKVVDKK